MKIEHGKTNLRGFDIFCIMTFKQSKKKVKSKNRKKKK